MTRPPLPPFTQETATQKVRAVEDGWNSRDPAKVALAYTPDSVCETGPSFFGAAMRLKPFLTRKWERENDYRLIKELWTFAENHIAVRFPYEWHDTAGNWFRSYGNENWEFASDGRMQRRIASINDLAIDESERKFRWPQGRRPDGHRGLSDRRSLT